MSSIAGISLSVVVLATVVAVFLLLLLWYVPKYQARRVPRKDRPGLENEFRKTLATILGGLAVLFGLFSTWQQLKYAGKSIQLSEEAQLSERYTKAIEKLGSQDLHLRLGGIYSLGQIAQRNDDHLWSVLLVLTAFVRDRAPYTAGKPAPMQLDADIQSAVGVISVQDFSPEPEASNPLQVIDLHGTDLRTGYLPGAWLRHVNFADAHLDSAKFPGAHMEKQTDFSNAYLQEAEFPGAHLDDAIFLGAHMNGAVLEGAILTNANLQGADLTGAYFKNAHLEGATLKEAVLDGAHLEGVDLSKVKEDLTWKQVCSAIRNGATVLPDYLKVTKNEKPCGK